MFSKHDTLFKMLLPGFWAVACPWAVFTMDADAATVNVHVKNFEFSPAKVTIHVGDTVNWIWDDPGHSVTFGSSCTQTPGGFDSGVLTAGSRSFTFNKSGQFSYFCRPHCGVPMTGTVKVEAASSPPPTSNKPNAYIQTNLVSDRRLVPATRTVDPKLLNAWGLVFNPKGPAWVADNGTNVSTLYDGTGAKKSLTVTVRGMSPTGIVFSGIAGKFKDHSGDTSLFILATEKGTIDAWAPLPNGSLPTVTDTMAKTPGAIYKGLALAGSGTKQFLFATDFHNRRIDVFDTNFRRLRLPINSSKPGCKFADPKIPANFAPFAIQNLKGNLYVTYAKQDADKEDDVAGPGNGFVNVFDVNGCFIRRVDSHGKLNSPWGLAIAPADFGKFGNHLLVGNFGDGTINAYDIAARKFRDQLRRPNGAILKIDGLWALAFGNGVQQQPAKTLFFTAGPGDEKHGLYGRIEPKR